MSLIDCVPANEKAVGLLGILRSIVPSGYDLVEKFEFVQNFSNSYPLEFKVALPYFTIMGNNSKSVRHVCG